MYSGVLGKVHGYEKLDYSSQEIPRGAATKFPKVLFTTRKKDCSMPEVAGIVPHLRHPMVWVIADELVGADRGFADVCVRLRAQPVARLRERLVEHPALVRPEALGRQEGGVRSDVLSHNVLGRRGKHRVARRSTIIAIVAPCAFLRRARVATYNLALALRHRLWISGQRS